jgi:uncharacterized membrane protein
VDRFRDELHDAGRDIDRLKALSDGVFAIVLTLLVLELRPERVTSNAAALEALARMIPSFVSYFISFFIIGLYWIVHNRMVRHMTGYDRATLWINLLFLLFVSVLPFFTAFSGQNMRLSLPWQLYAGNVVMVGLCGTWLWAAARRKGFVEEGVSRRLAAYLAARGLVVPAVFGASIPIAALNVDLARQSPILIPLALLAVHRRFAGKS